MKSLKNHHRHHHHHHHGDNHDDHHDNDNDGHHDDHHGGGSREYYDDYGIPKARAAAFKPVKKEILEPVYRKSFTKPGINSSHKFPKNHLACTKYCHTFNQ